MAVEKRNRREELRKRLKQLAVRFPQAEIARRTDTPPANVHRYLREGKIPVEFCAALVEEFQVSPIWLLTGEGGMLRSEVRKPIADMGGDLLELVETMNAVSRMRLGAVSGRPEQKALRDLSDAMESFDRMRGRLNEQSRPVLEGVLDEWGRAQDQMDMNRASSLRSTGQQLARLTTDEELLTTLDSREGAFHYLTGDVGGALAFERRVFARRLRDGEISSNEHLVTARNLVMSLRDLGRIQEARRLCVAALALTVPDVQDSPHYHTLRFFETNLDIELGDLQQGLSKVVERYPYCKDDHFVAGILYAHSQIVSGMFTWDEARDFGQLSSGKIRLLLRDAVMRDNADQIDWMLQHGQGDLPLKVPAEEYDMRFATLVLDLLCGRKRTTGDYDAVLAEHPLRLAVLELRRLLIELHRGQVARLAGDVAALKKCCELADGYWAQIAPDLTIKNEWLYMFEKNLAAIPARRMTRALRDRHAYLTARIEELYGRGYRFLKD